LLREMPDLLSRDVKIPGKAGSADVPDFCPPACFNCLQFLSRKDPVL
jgi:hypothetical protein